MAAIIDRSPPGEGRVARGLVALFMTHHNCDLEMSKIPYSSLATRYETDQGSVDRWVDNDHVPRYVGHDTAKYDND